jgi:hypothetical protein
MMLPYGALELSTKLLHGLVGAETKIANQSDAQ